jgi:hypothetical protein
LQFTCQLSYNGVVLDERLVKGITAQALEDLLRYRLGEPLVARDGEDEEDLYFDAVTFLARRPAIVRELERLTPKQLKKLLRHLEETVWQSR